MGDREQDKGNETKYTTTFFLHISRTMDMNIYIIGQRKRANDKTKQAASNWM